MEKVIETIKFAMKDFFTEHPAIGSHCLGILQKTIGEEVEGEYTTEIFERRIAPELEIAGKILNKDSVLILEQLLWTAFNLYKSPELMENPYVLKSIFMIGKVTGKMEVKYHGQIL